MFSHCTDILVNGYMFNQKENLGMLWVNVYTMLWEALKQCQWLIVNIMINSVKGERSVIVVFISCLHMRTYVILSRGKCKENVFLSHRRKDSPGINYFHHIICIARGLVLYQNVHLKLVFLLVKSSEWISLLFNSILSNSPPNNNSLPTNPTSAQM